MKNFNKLLSLTSCGVLMTSLTSCDTTDPSADNSEVTVNTRGFDLGAILAAPTETADFPTALSSGETFTFSGGQANITVSSSRQIIIENVRFNFVRIPSILNAAAIEQSTINAVIRSVFEDDMLAIVNAGTSSSAGSLANALLVPDDYDPTKGFLSFTTAEQETIINAIHSSGYVTRRTPGGGVEVLENRNIQLRSTSNNQKLVDDVTIEGNYALTNRWWPILLIRENEEPLLKLSLLLNNGQAVLHSENEVGTFTLKMNSLNTL